MATPGNIRCARCSMVVLDVFNAVMQDLMQHQPISAPDLYKMIMKDKYFRRQKLNSDEMHTIQTLLNEGFSKLDFSIIYKIAKYFRGFIPPPTRNWGANPLLNEIDIGDDVERIRRKRNRFVHQINANISEEDMNDFFDTVIEIGKRIDKDLNKIGLNSFEKTIQHYRSCSMEPETTDKYIRALQKIESLEKKLTVQIDGKELHFYEGKSIAHVIANVEESLNGEQTTALKLIFHDVKDEDEQIELLNKLCSENNINTENIKFICATKECIAVLVFLQHSVLVESTLLLSEVNLFVQKIISSTGMKFVNDKVFNIVIVSSEDESAESLQNQSNESVHDFKEPDRKDSSHALVLNLEMRNSVLQSTKSVHDNFERFFGNIIEKTDGHLFSHMDDPNLNVVLAVNDNDTIQSFNNSEAVSGFKSNYNRIREHETERKQHEFMLTQLTEKTQKAENSKQNADDCARKAEMERRVAEQKIEQLEKEKHDIQKQKEELEKEQNFTKTGFEMISYRIREHETERKEHALMLTQLMEKTQNAETSKRNAEDCARKAEMEKGVAENKIKLLEKEKHDIQNQKEELEKEQNITKTGLTQRIQLNQQNEKTIHKLEIQLQTLTEQIKKTQEDKKIAKNQAGNTIQQKQLYLDKAHKTIVRMERIIEKSEEEDAMKKWQKFRSKDVEKDIKEIKELKEIKHIKAGVEADKKTTQATAYVEKDMQEIKVMKAVLEAVVEEDTKTTQSTACTVS